MYKITEKLSLLVIIINVLLVSFALASNDGNSSSSSSGSESPSLSISAWVEGTDKETGELKKIFFSNESESEIVLRELKDVSVHCEAEYSVQLDFKSHGGFKLLATGSGSSSKYFSNSTHQVTIQKHTTYAHLVSLKEAYTGLYICRGRSSQTRNNTISGFIYVPTEKIFVSKKTSTISSSGQNPMIIPCPVSDPNATVTLVKLHEEDTIKPVQGAIYNPRIGFTVENEKDNETESDIEEGTFFCIAKTKMVHRAVEFTVIKGTVTCTQKCGENSKCQLVNDQQVCECKPSYKETLVSEKCLLECRTDKDCPSNMACVPQESGSFLLDILSSAEGRTIGSTKADEGHSHGEQHMRTGECKNPCVYRTTSCSLGASRNPNEECQVVEHKAICNNVSSETTTEPQ